MSIHKSKGLEFPVVIIPNMNLSTGIKNHSKFLFESDDYILYAGASKNSEIDVIKTFADIESNLILTDSVNKCYVALTRPVERLYIYNTFKSQSDFGDIFNTTLDNLSYPDETFVKSEQEGQLKITIGNRVGKQEEGKSVADTFFIPENVSDRLWFPDISLQDRKDLAEMDSMSDAQRYGNQLHVVLAAVNDKNEITTCFDNLVKSGIIEMAFVDRMKSEIEEIFENEEYQRLFENAIEIISEQDIIAGEFSIVRPDKLILKNDAAIILDYKTGLPKKKDVQQVKEYASVLKEIGYESVEAYLFYTSTKQITQVI
jgi:hypothetical protein